VTTKPENECSSLLAKHDVPAERVPFPSLSAISKRGDHVVDWCADQCRSIAQRDGFAWRMDLRQVFAANLRRLRHAKGQSQEDPAYEAEVNRT
jgi:hypothetical protein